MKATIPVQNEISVASINVIVNIVIIKSEVMTFNSSAKTYKNMNINKMYVARHTDHLPKRDFGKKLIFIFIISSNLVSVYSNLL